MIQKLRNRCVIFWKIHKYLGGVQFRNLIFKKNSWLYLCFSGVGTSMTAGRPEYGQTTHGGSLPNSESNKWNFCKMVNCISLNLVHEEYKLWRNINRWKEVWSRPGWRPTQNGWFLLPFAKDIYCQNFIIAFLVKLQLNCGNEPQHDW